MKAALAEFQRTFLEEIPTCQFQHVFVEDGEAESVVRGYTGTFERLRELEVDNFRFFLEDGRLIVRYIEKEVQSEVITSPPTLSPLIIIGFVWGVALLLTVGFVWVNLERYKNTLM